MIEWLKENWICIIGILIAAGIIVLIAWVVAYYEPLTEGQVVNKYYEPAHEVYSPIHVTIDGKDQTIRNYRFVGDKWTLIIQNEDKKDYWYVSESYYDSVKVGDWVSK